MEIDSKNILLIIIGLVFLAIIGVVIYLIAKSKSKSTPPSNQICSVSNKNGTCPDTYNCTQGICTTTVPPSSSCSALNPTGKCGALGWICSGGTCTDPSTCSASNPNGSCTQYGTVCTNGTCIIPQSTDCSSTNLKGNCPTGLSCVGGTCTDGSTCPNSCNGINCGDGCTTCTGVCPPGQCINGKCSASTCPDRCNGINCGDGCTTCPGVCPPGQCIGGTCSPCPANCKGINCGDGCTTCNSICPSGQTCVGGTCTKTQLPDCATNTSLVCNSTCTCATGKNCNTTSGKCIPDCTSSDDCSTGSCVCPGPPVRYCDNIKRCAIKGDYCDPNQTCTDDNCKCREGFTCNKINGWCVQDPIQIYGDGGRSVILADTAAYITGTGQAHYDPGPGCWTLDESVLLPLKDGESSTVSKIILPANVKATAYIATNYWRYLCSSGWPTVNCPPGETNFSGSTRPSGFKFEYVS